MTTVTFGGWLGAQDHRQDTVGELARYWKTLKGDRKIRALPSIQKELETTGALAEGSPVVAWWEQAIAEYRGSRTGSLASGDLRLAEPPAAEAPEGGYAVPMEVSPRYVLSVVSEMLEGQTRFLAAIAVRLGLSATEVQRLAAQCARPDLPEPEPVNWPELAGVADFEAKDEAQ